MFPLRGPWDYCHTCGSEENVSTVQPGLSKATSSSDPSPQRVKNQPPRRFKTKAKESVTDEGSHQIHLRTQRKSKPSSTHIPFLLYCVALLFLLFIYLVSLQTSTLKLFSNLFLTHFSGNCNSLILVYNYWNNMNLQQF